MARRCVLRRSRRGASRRARCRGRQRPRAAHGPAGRGTRRRRFSPGPVYERRRRTRRRPGQYSAWCSPKGRMLANFVVRRSAESSFELLLPESARADRQAPAHVRAALARPGRRRERRERSPGGRRPRRRPALCGVRGYLPSCTDRLLAGGIVSQLPGPRFVAIDPEQAAALDRLARRAGRGLPGMAVADGARGCCGHHSADADLFLPQTVNWDALGGISFRKVATPARRSSPARNTWVD